MKKKLCAFILLMTLVFSQTIPTFAAGDSISSATNISTGTTYSGSITSTNKADYYKFEINSSGRITLTASARMNWVYYHIYDSSGNELWSQNPKWNDTTELISTNETIDLTKGTYYFVIEQDSSYTGDYSFKLNFSSAGESFAETGSGSDNTLNSANAINVNNKYNGQLATNDEKDFYKFTLTSSGRISLSATAKMNWIYYSIYDSSGNELWSRNPKWNDTTETISTSEDIDLTKGTYYFVVSRDGSYTGNYSFKLGYTSANESFTETGSGVDNTINTANNISLNTRYIGQLAINDEKDFYKFTLNSSRKIYFTATANMKWIYYRIYDRNGNELWSSNPIWNSVTEKIDSSETFDLKAGTYYFVFERDGSYTGTYSFNIATSYPKTILLSQASYTYDGKVKKPSVTVKASDGKVIDSSNYTVSYASGRINVGTYKVSVKFKGNYSGTLSKTFRINPKTTGLSKLTAKSKGFTVKWKKQTEQVSGYQIQYSTSKSFSSKTTKTIAKNSTTSATYKKLKAKKKYYVRIRTYKNVSGTKYYSSWSSTKTVITKK